MEFTAKNIADILNGTVDGNPDTVVSDIAKIEEGKPKALSFLSNPKYTPYIYSTKSSVVIVNNSFKAEKEILTTLIRVENSYASFATLLEFIQNAMNEQESGISDLAYIHETATIGENVYIEPFANICKNAKIGDNVRIYSHSSVGKNVEIGKNTMLASGVHIYHNCKIGANCIFHSGSVIGSDGYGFAPIEGKGYKKIPQLGNVIIEDDVEVGSNTAIDRATMGSTIIRKGAKLDNLIQIGHNVEIGENTLIIAQTGISGSTKIGKNCTVGGQVGIAGHIEIADNVKIQAQSGIAACIKEGEVVQGSPAFNLKDYLRSYVFFKKLPVYIKKITTLEQRINELVQKIGKT